MKELEVYWFLQKVQLSPTFPNFLCAENSFFIVAKDKTPIKVTLRDGKVVDGQAWKTTPYDIASSIRYGSDLSKPVQSFDCPEIHV